MQALACAGTVGWRAQSRSCAASLGSSSSASSSKIGNSSRSTASTASMSSSMSPKVEAWATCPGAAPRSARPRAASAPRGRARRTAPARRRPTCPPRPARRRGSRQAASAGCRRPPVPALGALARGLAAASARCGVRPVAAPRRRRRLDRRQPPASSGRRPRRARPASTGGRRRRVGRDVVLAMSRLSSGSTASAASARRLALDAAGELGGRGHRLEAARRLELVLGEAAQQRGLGLLQEAGGELVQQAADLLGGVRRTGAPPRRCRGRSPASAASACSSERARCDRSVKPTVAELPASEWASAIGVSPSGRCSSIAHSATSVVSRRDSSSASFR